MEASEIFLRLLRGDILRSDDVMETILTREDFKTEDDWKQSKQICDGEYADRIRIERRYNFEEISIVPKEWPRDRLDLIAGTHDEKAQEFVNKFLPVKVFNLSITSADVIKSTHDRMRKIFAEKGLDWQRRDMPRTTFVFINAEEGLTSEEQSIAAKEEARQALGEYWKALEGTLDPQKVEKAADNALIGNPSEIVNQIKQRFDPDDRLMCWFDFFNHDNDRVIRNMEAWWREVVPMLE